MPITQKQIAEKLGFSREWVTRALNGDPSVPEATRKKVLAAARRIGYDEATNRDARSLISRRYGKRLKSGVIAVICPYQAISKSIPLHDLPPIAALFDGLQIEAHRRELDILLCSPRHGRISQLVNDTYVDGVICLGSCDFERELKGLTANLVTADVANAQISSVAPDQAEGMRLIVRHLGELGHRRLAYLGYGPTMAAGREAAYRAALAADGMAVEEALIEGSLHSGNGEAISAAIANLLPHADGRRTSGRLAFTALVCHDDPIAMGAILELRNRGFRVPEEISVTGFGAISHEYGFQPSITSIAYDKAVVGQQAVRLLCELEPGSAEPEPRHIIVPVTLQIGSSTARLHA